MFGFDDADELHLIDQATPTVLAYIDDHLRERGLEPARHVCWAGGTPMLSAARSVGWGEEARRSRVASWGLALGALRRELRERGGVTHLHCWSMSSLRAARVLRDAWPIMLHLVVMPGPGEVRYLRKRGVRVATAGRVLRRRLIGAGLDAALIDPMPLTPLGAARERVLEGRDAVRGRWGVPEDLPVVAVLSDPPGAQDALRAATVVNLVAEAAGREVRLLVHPEQRARPRVQTLLDRYRQPERLLQDGAIAAPWRVLAGCDAAMLLDAPAPLAARYAAAINLPTVAYDQPDHREALDGIDPGRVGWVPPDEAKKLPDRLQHGALAVGDANLLAGVATHGTGARTSLDAPATAEP